MGEIILDPPEDYLDARLLPVLINRWLASKRVGETTKAGYRIKINYFVEWWESIGATHEWRLTQSLLEEFERHLCSLKAQQSKEPLAWHTRNDALRRLKQMFRWAFKTERTSKNYGDWVPSAYGTAPERLPATIDQLANLMLAASESRMAVRDRAILAFFIGTGCRLGEVAGLSVDDLTLCADGSGTGFVTGKRTRANPTGRRAVAFDNTTGRYLTKYIDDMVVLAGPLWLAEDGDPLSRVGIYRMVKATIKRAGLSQRIQGCHDLRRNFSTIVGLMHPDNPMWADMIRRQLGHKRYSQTAAYTLLQADDIRERIASPLSLTENK